MIKQRDMNLWPWVRDGVRTEKPEPAKVLDAIEDLCIGCAISAMHAPFYVSPCVGGAPAPSHSKAVVRVHSIRMICRCREPMPNQKLIGPIQDWSRTCAPWDTLLASSNVNYVAHLLPPLVLELRPRSRLLRKLSMLGRRELELERRRL
jgi:hypothetical protein